MFPLSFCQHLKDLKMAYSAFLLWKTHKHENRKIERTRKCYGKCGKCNEKEWGTQKSVFSCLFLRLMLHFIAVAKSAHDLRPQQLFTPIDISINQSGSIPQSEGRRVKKGACNRCFLCRSFTVWETNRMLLRGHLVKVCCAVAVITSKPMHDSLQPTRRLKNSILNYTGDILVTVGTV